MKCLIASTLHNQPLSNGEMVSLLFCFVYCVVFLKPIHSIFELKGRTRSWKMWPNCVCFISLEPTHA